MALFRGYSEPISIRGLFSCCYGGHKNASPNHKPQEHPLTDGAMAGEPVDNGLDDSDDEDKQEYHRMVVSSSAHQLPDEPRQPPVGVEDIVVPEEEDYRLEDELSNFGDLESEKDMDEKETRSVQCGQLEVGFEYDGKSSKLTVIVGQTRDLPENKGKWSEAQVRMALLYNDKVRRGKESRKSTAINRGENPMFNEKFEMPKITPPEFERLALRFRLYGCERRKRSILLGESIIGLLFLYKEYEKSKENNHQKKIEVNFSLRLEPRADGLKSRGGSDTGYSDTASSIAASSMSLGVAMTPELLVSLSHNGLTGRLSVEIIKGSGFKMVGTSRAPDTYVKLSIMSHEGNVVWKAKTVVIPKQANPTYRESFMFPVALFQLTDVTLVVSVYIKKSMNRREMLGWFSTGKNNSGEEELTHWQDMKELKGKPVCRWHVLLKPSLNAS